MKDENRGGQKWYFSGSLAEDRVRELQARGSDASKRPIGFALKAGFFAAMLLTSLGSAQAVFTTQTFTPNPANLNDLDHHSAYSWKLSGLTTQTITYASINISQIQNWDATANMLFVWLLDTAINPGVFSIVDDPTNSAPAPISDYFAGSASGLISATTAKTKLTEASFTMTPVNWSYTFDSYELGKLNQYIAATTAHTIALGFDPDCHYFNNGICFTIGYGGSPGPSPIPEVSAFAPVGGVLGLAIGVQTWLRRRRTERLAV
jgi:hypothetical protein